MKKENIKYFVIAVLVMYLAPTLIFFATVWLSGGTLEFAHLFIIPALISAFAFVFGRLFTSSYKITEPKSRAALYAPAFMPALMLPFVCLLAESISNFDIYWIILMPNLWSVLQKANAELADYRTMGLYGIYLPSFGFDVLYGLFFVLGERSAAKKRGIKRDKFKMKYIAVLAAYFAVFCGGIAYYDYYTELTTVTGSSEDRMRAIRGEMDWVPTGTNTNGYGFAYEGGWSSVDLKPYYVENPENKLAKLNEPAELIISDVSKMPVLDGAEATYPVYSAFANACYENIAEIQEYAKSEKGIEKNAPKPVQFTNTIEAYKSLVNGDVDIFFGSMPSPEQKQLAADAGKELVYTPIGKEAFVFFVSEDNPVDGLTSEQVRDIYSGKITNWRKVGGRNLPILAFQRPKNSGSQTRMEYFMGDVPLKEPLKAEFEISMVGVVSSVAGYQNKKNAIGYSFRYYATQMVLPDDSGHMKFLSLDGVYPSPESIADNSYPLTGQLYAVSLADNDNEYVEKLLEFMTSEQGRQIVRETGYII